MRTPRADCHRHTVAQGLDRLKGGLIDDLVLEKYRETVDPKSPNVVLFSPPDAPDAYFAEYGWLDPGAGTGAVPDSETQWQAKTSGPLTPDLAGRHSRGTTARA